MITKVQRLRSLQPMQEGHPMWDRLQAVLARLGVSIEHATAEALMNWVCMEEATAARERVRSWTMADVEEAVQWWRFQTTRPGFTQTGNGPIVLTHDDPFAGTIIVDGDLLNHLLREEHASDRFVL